RNLLGATFITIEMLFLGVFVVAASTYVAHVVARSATDYLDRQALVHARAADESPVLAADESAGANPPVLPSQPSRPEGAPFGIISIPRIGLEAPVHEGVGDRTLDVAVGRIPGTSDSVDAGNIALAGHRDTKFRPLRRVRVNDHITLETAQGSFDYTV